MRVLIVFHGWFPRPDRPVAGGALRAWHHAEAIAAAGHEVHLVTREQDAVPDGPPTFRSGPDLLAHARRVRPEVVLCVQPEEAPNLVPLGVPMAVDLYAPRLLEAQFQDQSGEEAVQTLRAIQAGDFFLFSNPRQRFYFLGLLAMAGVDLRDERFGAVVPLVAPEGPPRQPPEAPIFVLGGVAWPWIDPLEGLQRAVAHLRKRRRGRVLVLGGQPVVGTAAVRDLPAAMPPGPRLEYRGPVPYQDLLALYAGATAALDLMAPTPERTLAVAFRHMDYLGCGLPMIVGAEHVLGDVLRETGAGLVGLPVEEAIDRALDDPEEHEARAAACRELARARFGRAACEAALLAWLAAPARRERRATPVGERAELAARVAAAEAARGEAERMCARTQAEVGAKRAEVAGLVDQVRVLSVANERLSGAVAEVAGFKREAIAVLGGAEASAREQAEALRAQVAVLATDAAKKNAEIDTLSGEKRALAEQVVELRRRQERAEAEAERQRAVAAAQADELEAARLDAQKKSGEVDALEREKRQLASDLVDLRRQLARAEAAVAQLRGEAAAAADALESALLDAQKKSGEIDALEREKRLLAGDLVELRRIAEQAGAEADALRAAAVSQADALEAARLDAQKKSGEIDALEREKRLLTGDLVELRRLAEQAGAEATGLREAAVSRADALESALLDAQKKSGEIDALEREKRLLRDQVLQAQRDATATGAEAARLGVENARQAASLGEARDDLAKKAAEVAALVQERDGVREQLEEARTRLADAEAAVRDAADEARQVARTLARAEADIAKKAAEIEALRQVNLRLVEDGQAALGALDAVKAELKRAEAEQRLTQQLLDRVRGEAEAGAAALLDARADIAAKVAEHGGTQRLLDRARQEAEAANGALADARADATAKGVELTLLQQARASMIAERDAATGALDEVRVQALRHEAELRLTQGLLDEAREARDRLGARAASLEADLAAKAATVAALERAWEQERGRGERAGAQLERTRAEVVEQREALARAEVQAGQAAARIEALEASLSDCAGDIAKKNRELEEAWAERDRLERLITDLKGKR